MGQYHRFLGNKTVALKWFARSISTLRPLVEKNPRNAEARHCLSNAYWWQAEMLHGMNRSTDAIGDLDRALAVGSPPNQTGLRAMKACILISMGEHAKAIIEADAAAAPKDASALALYNAGCAYSLCAAAASKDAKLPADERKKRAEQYAQQALN